MTSNRMQRVIEIVEAVQSDIEQILLLLKMQEEDKPNEDEPKTLDDVMRECGFQYASGPIANGFTRTDLDESANEKLKQLIQGFAYRKLNSEN